VPAAAYIPGHPAGEATGDLRGQISAVELGQRVERAIRRLDAEAQNVGSLARMPVVRG
jgi:hypothetical protein